MKLAAFEPSPQYRAKGLVYLHTQAFCDERVPGGWAAVREALDEELRDFTDRIFLASGWYDVLPVVPISEAAARLAQSNHREMIIESARFTARRDVRAIHKILLTLSSIEQVAMRLPRVALQYFDFGETDARVVEPGVVTMSQRGIPAPIATWMVRVVEGFAPVVLEAAGARNVRLKLAKPIGRESGPTCSLDWELRWAK